jgi:hypothetical protein
MKKTETGTGLLILAVVVLVFLYYTRPKPGEYEVNRATANLIVDRVRDADDASAWEAVHSPHNNDEVETLVLKQLRGNTADNELKEEFPEARKRWEKAERDVQCYLRLKQMEKP